LFFNTWNHLLIFFWSESFRTWNQTPIEISVISRLIILHKPAKLPDMAASKVDTWKSLKASSTWVSEANDWSCIFAKDSDNRITASSCLQSRMIKLNIGNTWIVKINPNFLVSWPLLCFRNQITP
jgi:hypothetical protein